MDRSLTRCPCWPASTANLSGLVTLTFDLWPFDLISSVRVTWEVCCRYANFSLPRPLRSRLRPDVLDRQTSDKRQTSSSLNTPWAGHNKWAPYTKDLKMILLLLCPRPHRVEALSDDMIRVWRLSVCRVHRVYASIGAYTDFKIWDLLYNFFVTTRSKFCSLHQ